MIIPAAQKKPPNEQKLQKFHQKWQESTDVLENVWLKRSPYLAGNRLTTSDLLGKSNVSLFLFSYLDVE